MSAAQLLAFNVALIAALASPGPAMLMSVRATITGGLRQGLLTGLGLATMAACWTGTAFLGLHALFTLFPWIYATARVAGALYLIWIAVRIWRHATTKLDPSVMPAPKRRAFFSGVAVNLANPKSVLFAGSVLMMIFPDTLPATDKALIVLNHWLVEIAAYSGFALLLSGQKARAGYLRLKPVLDRITATVLGALGLTLLTDR